MQTLKRKGRCPAPPTETELFPTGGADVTRFALVSRGVTVLTALGVGLIGKPDEEQLPFAAAHECVLYTYRFRERNPSPPRLGQLTPRIAHPRLWKNVLTLVLSGLQPLLCTRPLLIPSAVLLYGRSCLTPKIAAPVGGRARGIRCAETIRT